MKKFTKVCLIICAIFVGLGLLLTVIGVSRGFGIQQFRRMAWDGIFSIGPEDWYLDEDISDTTGQWENIEEDAVEGADASEDTAEDADAIEETMDSAIEHDHANEGDAGWNQVSGNWTVEKVENLDIQFGYGTLRIEPSDSGNIEVEVGYRNSHSRAIGMKLDHDTLKIRDTINKHHLLSHNKGDAVLTIRIPEEKVFREVDLDIGGACVYVNTGIRGKELDITLGAGEMLNQSDTAAALHADEINLEIGAGNMELDGIKARELSVECGTGQMELSGVDAENTDVECGVGKITMSMADEQEAYDYEVECGIGQVLVGEASYSGLGRSKTVQNGGERFMDIDCGLGEIDISFEK